MDYNQAKTIYLEWAEGNGYEDICAPSYHQSYVEEDGRWILRSGIHAATGKATYIVTVSPGGSVWVDEDEEARIEERRAAIRAVRMAKAEENARVAEEQFRKVFGHMLKGDK